MPEWKPAPTWEWEYRRPPYRGVLITVHLVAPGNGKQFAAHVETPLGPRGAPHLFVSLEEAQRWVEHEVERLAAVPEVWTAGGRTVAKTTGAREGAGAMIGADASLPQGPYSSEPMSVHPTLKLTPCRGYVLHPTPCTLH